MDRTFNVLFLCTKNSARSIMAEAVLNYVGKGRLRGYSAGSQPSGTVHPNAIAVLSQANCELGALRSKSWDEFAGPGAPAMDFIITLCDDAAGEPCPVWPGHPITTHWSVEDPAAFQGTADDKLEVFHKVFRDILNQINIFASLPLHVLEKNAIQHELDKIGASAAAV